MVGPVCESGDYLALTGDMPEVAAGDLIAVMSAGAYGAVQAGNLQHPAARSRRCWSSGDRHAVVRPRRSYEELIGLDTLPPWLE